MYADKNRKPFAVGAMVLVALFIVLLGLICAYASSATGIMTGAANTTIWALVITVLVIFILLIVLVLAVVGLRHIEQTKLFQPTVVKRYPETFRGQWYPLKHGGGLMNTTPERNDPSIRRVLFLHGNSYDLAKYDPALKTLEAQGYDVWAVEYAGFGITTPVEKDVPNSESCLRDVMDAWAVCGRSDAIVIGFSLGGAILGEVYEALNPMPAQLVFLNTFASFPLLVKEKMGTGLVGPFLATQWSTPEPKHYQGKVTIVYTMDDAVIPPEQGRRLCKIFRKLLPRFAWVSYVLWTEETWVRSVLHCCAHEVSYRF